MIATITMNPCIDQTLMIPDFQYGGLNRVEAARTDVGGKGINVSAVLTQLGHPVRTLGLNFQNGGHDLAGRLLEQKIHYEYIMAPGSIRENIKICNRKDQITTELNQRGTHVSLEILERMTAMVEQCLSDPEIQILVISGSVPEGVPVSYYRQLTEIGNRRGKKVILDADGDYLLEGIKAKPYLIKPNLQELIRTFGLRSAQTAEILAVCRKIIDSGISIVCLSMGQGGALITDGHETWQSLTPSIAVKSTQGAGDSLVAGICIAIEKGLPMSEMLRYGVIAAQGSVTREGTMVCTKEDFTYFKSRIAVERIG